MIRTLRSKQECLFCRVFFALFRGSRRKFLRHFTLQEGLPAAVCDGKERTMRVIYEDGALGPVVFAAQELQRYLEQMVKDLAQAPFSVRLQIDAGLCDASGGCDAFLVQVTQDGGVIAGGNPRSVLLGVYDYLHHLGCRFLLPAQGGEVIPQTERGSLCADYEKSASFYHRGVCIEGADSFENIRDFIDWLPKLGYNSFFLQFQVPYAFLARWYHHDENPYRDAQPFTYGDATRCMEELEAQLEKRGLLLHKIGHGWTGEALGYQTASWDTNKETVTPQVGRFAAELDGERKLYQGIPANTNLCYHSEEAIDVFAASVATYAKEHPQVDYLHIWLADDYNNVCECEDCVKTTLSDQYVDLLNEIDRRLAEEGLETRIVFLLYQELLWPPVKKRLIHPQRFVLMFAPISRTFEESYALDQIPQALPEYVRNQIVLPASLGENLAYLRGWQAQFEGDSFVYDYPLGRAHYGDFGYLHIARVIHGDIQKLREMGLNGYISCQELRACFPNAMPNYMMGRTLFCEQTDPQELIREYFDAAYGAHAREAQEYLEQLSALECCDYINGKGGRIEAEIVHRMQRLRTCCEVFHPGEWQSESKTEQLFYQILEHHRRTVLYLAHAVLLLASGEKEQALEAWKEMREYICKAEPQFQPYLDVYRILEVTQKYTGFR